MAAIVETKLSNKSAAMKWTPLLQIFMDSMKDFDALDRGRFLGILWKSGLGPRVMVLIEAY